MTGNELLEELRRASRSKKIPTAEKINLVLAALADVAEGQAYMKDWVAGLKEDADKTHAAFDVRLAAAERNASLLYKLHGAVAGTLLALQTYLAAMR